MDFFVTYNTTTRVSTFTPAPANAAVASPTARGLCFMDAVLSGDAELSPSPSPPPPPLALPPPPPSNTSANTSDNAAVVLNYTLPESIKDDFPARLVYFQVSGWALNALHQPGSTACCCF
jgi:hypothetical protein